MPTYDCDDFRVSFEHIDPTSYTATARAADGREVRSTFTLPMTRDRLEQAILQLGRPTSRSRSREVAPEMVATVRADAEDLGAGLGTALFDSTIGPFYDDARRSAARHGRGVRLTLSLASTPELLSVPWELLYRRPRFLASQRRTPVVRYLEVGDMPSPECIEGPVRVLGVVASPTGLPQLDVADERRRVEQALAAMIGKGLVQLDWCDPATPRSLRQRLRDGSYHILHYVGHSDFTADGDGLLFLVDEAGGPAQVTESVLTNLLGDQTSLRLAVLNSCEGARTTLTDPFAGIATSLVALGVPAVVAMQFVISDAAAIVFAEELFTSLIGRQYPIDAAVAEARKAVFTEVNEIEWATPVLFLRSDNGELFDFVAEPVPLPLPVAPTPIDADDLDGAGSGGPAPTPSHGGAPPFAPPAVRASGAADGASAAAVTPQVVAPQTITAQPAKKRWWTPRRIFLAGALAALVVVTAILAFLWKLGEPTDEDGRLEITPLSGPLLTTISLRGGECPLPPDDALRTGVAYWLDLIHEGVSRTVASGDIPDDSDGSWTASLVVPADGSADAGYEVGASCWATYADGHSENFFLYPTVPFDVVDDSAGS